MLVSSQLTKVFSFKFQKPPYWSFSRLRHAHRKHGNHGETDGRPAPLADCVHHPKIL